MTPPVEALDLAVEDRVLSLTGATAVRQIERLQTLWSGYGALLRVTLDGGGYASVIVKQVHFPDSATHPRGWNGARGDARKRRSYSVEASFYDSRARRRQGDWRLPVPIDIDIGTDAPLLVLEDLGPTFPTIAKRLEPRGVRRCLDWLAEFHAEHLGDTADGLWPNGCYWDLDTRPDEFEAMAAGPHHDHAEALHRRLHEARYRTLVHGDAKVANVLLSADGSRVAMVDYQYVGGGPGIRDVAYLVGSCLSVETLERHGDALLDHYVQALRQALARHHPSVDADAASAEALSLYPIAWADFDRFLLGWAPSHPKLNRYGEGLAKKAFAAL